MSLRCIRIIRKSAMVKNSLGPKKYIRPLYILSKLEVYTICKINLVSFDVNFKWISLHNLNQYTIINNLLFIQYNFCNLHKIVNDLYITSI